MSQPSSSVLKLRFVGDVMFGRYRSGGFDPLAPPGEQPFRAVQEWLQGDIVVANLETPVVAALPERAPGSGFFFGADRDGVSHLKAAGFTHLTLANNHAADLGLAGLLETPRHLRAFNIVPLGAARESGPAIAAEALAGSEPRVVFIAVTTRLNFLLSEAPQVPYLQAHRLPSNLAPLLKGEPGDFKIVLLHWGTEYARHPDTSQRRVARRLVELGADLVIGHHPHVLQEFELYQGALIAYSLGNFLFDNPSPDARLTGVLAVDVLRRGCKLELRFEPAVITRRPFHPVPATAELAEAARKRVLPLSRQQRDLWQRDGEALVAELQRRDCPLSPGADE